MTIDAAIADLVRQAVREAVDPLARQLAALREERAAEMVDASEAARRLGVSVRTVQRMIRAGEIKGMKVGRTYRVRMGDVVR